jgi:pimeloyl-ACP methyl ester carboxylesterase
MDSPAATPTDRKTFSKDGVSIQYRFVNTGGCAIVFVHGWGDSMNLWTPHVAAVSPPYSTMLLDLAGHGSSGKARSAWTIEAFADDVCAVCDALRVKRFVLVGHSMGGPIILEVALRMPDRIAGLVPIDILVDVDYVRTPQERENFFRHMREDFSDATSSLVFSLFPRNADKDSVERIIAMETSNDPTMMVPALEAAMAYDVRAAMSRIRAPLVAINSDLSPTSLENNRRYAPQFEAIIMRSVSHWLMLDRPEEFDETLRKALDLIKCEAET